MPTGTRAAIFLDRDGTIIEDTGYPKDPALVKFEPGAVAGLKRLQANGYLLLVLSNQSGVGRGLIKDFEFNAVHERFGEILKAENIVVTQVAYCFHTPEDKCDCRKPETKLARAMAKDFNVDFTQSVMVGDRHSDLELGERLGMKVFLVETGVGLRTKASLGAEFPAHWQVTANLETLAATLPPALS